MTGVATQIRIKIMDKSFSVTCVTGLQANDAKGMINAQNFNDLLNVMSALVKVTNFSPKHVYKIYWTHNYLLNF